jgi:hypothetical protein
LLLLLLCVYVDGYDSQLSESNQSSCQMNRRGPKGEPLLRIGGKDEDEIADYARYGSSSGRTVTAVMGVLAFIALLVVAAVGLWRLQVVQEDLSNLNYRLDDAEALLIVHTQQINTLNTTLITTIQRVTINTQNIATLNLTTMSQGLRITSLENRTTTLENRLTLDEIKLLGVMNNVTLLQIEVAQAQLNITILQSQVSILQLNVSNHEARLLVLEAGFAQQAVVLANLLVWLQQNLTIIDQRLDILNVTYVVTGRGAAMVASGPALTSPVTWETRHFTDVGLDFEYLWISDTNWNPTQIRIPGNGSSWNFQITNFTLTSPVGVVPAPSVSLDRPLAPFQQSKFLLQSFQARPQVVSAAWDNINVALNFRSTLDVFDAVTIVRPLTFVIGFL